MLLAQIKAKARLRVRHERPYDYDDARNLWLYRRVDDDEEYGNILTDDGRVSIHTLVYGTSAQKITASLGAGLHFIGLSNDATSPAAGDTTLTAELATNGLQRAIGTVTLPTGSGAITTVQKQFTYAGGGTQGVQKTALFDAVSSGNMAHEILFTQRTLATSDTLTMTFSITLT
jgi:hypothetical protein